MNETMFGEFESKLRSNTRTFVLEEIPDYKPLKSKGMLDPQIFKGGNSLRAIRSDEDQLWHLKYEKGSVPGELNQRFTKFEKAKEFVERYFNLRGYKVKDIVE